MKLEQDFFRPTPDCDYSVASINKVRTLPQGSVVFIDVDGTAVKSIGGVTKVRADFDELYRFVQLERPDLALYTISYRSRKLGIPELAGYEFTMSIYMEEMKAVLSVLSEETIAQSIIAFLNQIDDFTDDYKLPQEISHPAVIKLRFLIAMFAEELVNGLLIDDGADGRLATILGIGIEAR